MPASVWKNKHFMKKTIAITVFVAALALAGAARAQAFLSAGFTSKNASVKSTFVNKNDASVDSAQNSWRGLGNGYYFGVGYNYTIWKGIGVATGVTFDYYTHTETKSGIMASMDFAAKTSVKSMGLSFPLLVTYRHEFYYDLVVGKVYAGPVFQLGLSAKGETEVSWPSIDSVEVHPFDHYELDDNGESRYRKFNMGIMIGTGVELWGARFDIGYSFGLLEYSNEGLKDRELNYKYESVITGQFFVGLGYSFDPFPKNKKR